MRGDRVSGAGPAQGAVTVQAAAALVGALCAIYLVSQFLRNSVGVIAPNLAAELNLSPEQLGILSSAFFLSFAVAQVPLGAMIDRYGPRLCMIASVGLAVAGCGLFSVADTLTELTAARVLMGLGCSSFFMGPLTIYTRWFAADRFSTLTGLQLGIGTMGTLFATAPLAMSAEAFGWRATFVFVGVGAAVIGVLVALVVRDRPPGAAEDCHQPASLAESFAGLGEVVRVKGFWRLFAIQFAGYSTFVAVLGLWGGPFATDILGFDLKERGNILFAMAAAHIVGLFVWGPTDRWFGQRRLPVTLGVFGTAAIFAALCLVGDRGPVTAYVLFMLLGFVAAFTPVQTAHGRALFDQRLVGRGITLLNVATIGGVFVTQAITGAIIGAFPATESALGPVRPFVAYQAAFGFLALMILLAWLVYWPAPDPKIRRGGEG